MKIDFYKCESNLNDFILIENKNLKLLKKDKLSNQPEAEPNLSYSRDNPIIYSRKGYLTNIESKIAQYLTNRKAGIGGDGVIIFSKINQKTIKIYVINKDGTYPEMCINGLFSATAFTKNIYGFVDCFIYYNIIQQYRRLINWPVLLHPFYLANVPNMLHFVHVALQEVYAQIFQFFQ